MSETTDIYLADDKDGKKVIVVGYQRDLDSFPTTIKVGEWTEYVDDWDQSWDDEPLIFEIDELLGHMRNPSHLMGPDDPDDIYHVENLGLCWPGSLDLDHYQLKNLCKHIVAGTEEPVKVGCCINYVDRNESTGWGAHLTIDPVLAQAIIDSYN